MQISAAKKQKLRANLGKPSFEDLHPKYPKGHPKGGQFMPKGSTDYVNAVAKNTGKPPAQVKGSLGGDGSVKPTSQSSTKAPSTPLGKRNYKDFPQEVKKEIQDRALELATAAKAQDVAEQAKLNAGKGGKREAGKAFTAAKKEVTAKQKAVEAVLVKHGASKEKAKQIAEKLIAQKVGQVKDGAKSAEKPSVKPVEKVVAEKTKTELGSSKFQSLKGKFTRLTAEPKFEAKKAEPKSESEQLKEKAALQNSGIKILNAPPKSKESIGKGEYGEVYLTPTGTAYKSALDNAGAIPASEINIMNEAGNLGVAPKIKGVYKKANGDIQGVEMQFLSDHKTLVEVSNDDFGSKAVESLNRSLAILHKNRIIHGDLHEENVLIDKKGEAKIIDFGFSSKVSSKPDAIELKSWAIDVSSANHLSKGFERGEYGQLYSNVNEKINMIKKEVEKLKTTSQSEKEEYYLSKMTSLYQDFSRQI
jgi:tRNA A-37 threonylcarbamoyl transferase component Bud32